MVSIMTNSLVQSIIASGPNSRILFCQVRASQPKGTNELGWLGPHTRIDARIWEENGQVTTLPSQMGESDRTGSSNGDK
jgi:hypothetical protein